VYKVASTSVLDIIAKETNGKSYKTFKYSFESMSVPTMDYDEHDRKFTWKKHSESGKAKEVVHYYAGQIMPEPWASWYKGY